MAKNLPTEGNNSLDPHCTRNVQDYDKSLLQLVFIGPAQSRCRSDSVAGFFHALPCGRPPRTGFDFNHVNCDAGNGGSAKQGEPVFGVPNSNANEVSASITTTSSTSA